MVSSGVTEDSLDWILEALLLAAAARASSGSTVKSERNVGWEPNMAEPVGTKSAIQFLD